jgi:hypothetical protein
MIAKLQHWWKRRRCCYVYIDEDEPPPSSYPSTKKKTPKSTNKGGVPERTIITDSSEDSTPEFDITTVYTPVGEKIIPRLITKVTINTTRSNSQCDKGPRFGTVQVKDYFVSSRSGASLCSLDSLTDSYWGASSSRQNSVTADDDDEHQAFDDYFFNEHVRYLRIQTTPQQVEVVSSPNSVPPTTTRGRRAVERFWCQD